MSWRSCEVVLGMCGNAKPLPLFRRGSAALALCGHGNSSVLVKNPGRHAKALKCSADFMHPYDSRSLRLSRLNLAGRGLSQFDQQGMHFEFFLDRPIEEDRRIRHAKFLGPDHKHTVT